MIIENLIEEVTSDNFINKKIFVKNEVDFWKQHDPFIKKRHSYIIKGKPYNDNYIKLTNVVGCTAMTPTKQEPINMTP